MIAGNVLDWAILFEISDVIGDMYFSSIFFKNECLKSAEVTAVSGPIDPAVQFLCFTFIQTKIA